MPFYYYYVVVIFEVLPPISPLLPPISLLLPPISRSLFSIFGQFCAIHRAGVDSLAETKKAGYCPPSAPRYSLTSSASSIVSSGAVSAALLPYFGLKTKCIFKSFVLPVK